MNGSHSEDEALRIALALSSEQHADELRVRAEVEALQRRLEEEDKQRREVERVQLEELARQLDEEDRMDRFEKKHEEERAELEALARQLDEQDRLDHLEQEQASERLAMQLMEEGKSGSDDPMSISPSSSPVAAISSPPVIDAMAPQEQLIVACSQLALVLLVSDQDFCVGLMRQCRVSLDFPPLEEALGRAEVFYVLTGAVNDIRLAAKIIERHLESINDDDDDLFEEDDGQKAEDDDDDEDYSVLYEPKPKLIIERLSPVVLPKPKAAKKYNNGRKKKSKNFEERDARAEGRRRAEVEIYVDSSNILIGSQEVCGTLIDVGLLAALFERGGGRVTRRFAAGSHVRGYDNLKILWESCGYKTQGFESRIPGTGEEMIDAVLQSSMSETIMRAAMGEKALGPRTTIVLCTGDGNSAESEKGHHQTFPKLVKSYLRLGFQVDLFAWRKGCSGMYRDILRHHNSDGRFSIFYLDDYITEICK